MQRNKIITKSAGLNEAEKYLAKLCDRTFLSIWNYPNLYRAKGKELSDLLVVFDNHILIFSDKDCKYPSTNNLELNWSRWFRRAVAKSAKQLWRAEQWIRQHPDRIFLDKECLQTFPFEIDTRQAKFHLILVARGVSEACKKFFGSGSGSLMIRNDIKGISAHTEPFVIGDIDPTKTFIHVLDDTTLDIVMGALDTVSDFISYISKKEILFRSNKKIFATGEEDLLPSYMTKMRGEEHDFDFPEDSDGIVILEGAWEKFCNNPQRKAQFKENEISCFWDALIEQFNKHALTGTQEYVWPPSFGSSEKVTRFLAAQPRFIRRILAESFLEILRNTPANQRMIRVIPPWRSGDPYFVFLIFPFRQDRSYEENRRVRMNFLEACCRVVKLKYPDATDIVGVATESGRMEREEGSEDACYLDARIWTEENEREAKELQSKLAILINPNLKPMHALEYPEPTTIPSAFVPKVGRNAKCPCGSGKKYKKCHGLN